MVQSQRGCGFGRAAQAAASQRSACVGEMVRRVSGWDGRSGLCVTV